MEAFKIKNGLSAKRYLGSTTTLSGSTIDLSLGSMFSTTLSSDPAYTFTNPPASGNAQAFSVEVTGGTTTFTNDAFATTLYTGNGTSQTITNGLDLANDGGLVWLKARSATGYEHELTDTVRGTTSSGKALNSNDSQPEQLGDLTSFNSSGFGLSYNTANGNGSGINYAAWSFKKQTKFFDIVTYTGNDVSGREIAHNLGSVPGSIIIKETSNTYNWQVFHRSIGPTKFLELNTTGAQQTSSALWDDTDPTSTVFTIGNEYGVNRSGRTYVAYLFAHDTASDSRIKCGSFTGVGSGAVDVDLGWGPQFVLTKNASRSADWMMQDTTRGMSETSWNPIIANKAEAELSTSENRVVPTTTGFTVNNNGGNDMGQSGDTVIYMAIRGDAATDSAITWPSSVKWPSGVAPTTPAAGTKDLFTFLTTDGGTTYYGKKAAEGLA